MAIPPAIELEDLRERLREAEETLAAIRNGEVDSLIVSGADGDRVYSLKGAEHPYRVFVEKMLEGAVTLSTEGVILYSNHRFAEMMRSPLERVIGAELRSFFRAADQEALNEVLRNPENRKMRQLLSAADGTLIPVQLTFSRLPIEEVESICLVVTDLTEQEEKRQLSVALDELRSAQLRLQEQNSELAQARVAAEAASQAKDNFLASLSHELRTPLTPVVLAIASMESNPGIPAELRPVLAMIRRNASLEARLIDDLLDLTSIVRGKIVLKSEDVDVHNCLNDVLETCEADAAAKQLRVVRQFDARQTRVRGDAVRIQQIFWNLVRNAVKFSPVGGQITIKSSDEDGSLQVDVIDSGIGIEAEALEKIFVPFEQTGRHITREFGGLGLGLAISRRLAEAQGGRVTARSDGKGRGAAFSLLLPLAGDAQPAQVPPRKTPAPIPACARLKILLVEDHDDTRHSLAISLRTRHNVFDVADIASALAAARKDHFDLVITDIGLPDGSGVDLLSQLKQQYPIRGICLSGYGSEKDLSRSAAVGFEHHLVKPIDFEKLQAVINQVAGFA